jgi:hypothetical protein
MKPRRNSALLGLARAMRDSARPGVPGFGERLAAMPRLAGAVLRGRYQGIRGGLLLGDDRRRELPGTAVGLMRGRSTQCERPPAAQPR